MLIEVDIDWLAVNFDFDFVFFAKNSVIEKMISDKKVSVLNLKEGQKPLAKLKNSFKDSCPLVQIIKILPKNGK